MIEKPDTSNFLLSSRFRGYRIAIVFLFFCISSTNTVMRYYLEPGNLEYLFAFLIAVVYMSMVYILLNIAVPRYLPQRKYFQFILCILGTSFVFALIPEIMAIPYVGKSRISLSNVMGLIIHPFLLYTLCLTGVTIPAFLENWTKSNQQLNRLKNRHQISRIEHLKEQINPDVFFRTLDKSNDYLQSDPQKSSETLMKLGKLLRYQLYDCNMKQVLLSAEVSFLQNFLELEKISYPLFSYRISVSENINTLFISPSILLPYVQSALNALPLEKEHTNMDLSIDVTSEAIVFAIHTTGNSDIGQWEKELLNITERLDILYKGQYMLAAPRYNPSREIESRLMIDRY